MASEVTPHGPSNGAVDREGLSCPGDLWAPRSCGINQSSKVHWDAWSPGPSRQHVAWKYWSVLFCQLLVKSKGPTLSFFQEGNDFHFFKHLNFTYLIGGIRSQLRHEGALSGPRLPRLWFRSHNTCPNMDVSVHKHYMCDSAFSWLQGMVCQAVQLRIQEVPNGLWPGWPSVPLSLYTLSSSKCHFCSWPSFFRDLRTPLLQLSPLEKVPSPNSVMTLLPRPSTPSQTWCPHHSSHPSSLTRSLHPPSLPLWRGHWLSGHLAPKAQSYLRFWTPVSFNFTNNQSLAS